jgi:hypothetical protein
MRSLRFGNGVTGRTATPDGPVRRDDRQRAGRGQGRSERGKIRFDVHYPSVVKDFRTDFYGNLEAYVLEYEVSDPRIDQGKPFIYAKEVQRDFIAYYKNGTSVRLRKGGGHPNPYGFVPAVWVKHIDIGNDYGVPAIRSAIAKIDELNSMVSHTADHIHKQIESPRILWTDSQVKPLFGNGMQSIY